VHSKQLISAYEEGNLGRQTNPLMGHYIQMSRTVATVMALMTLMCMTLTAKLTCSAGEVLQHLWQWSGLLWHQQLRCCPVELPEAHHSPSSLRAEAEPSQSDQHILHGFDLS